jgi:hypothetical protein
VKRGRELYIVVSGTNLYGVSPSTHRVISTHQNLGGTKLSAESLCVATPIVQQQQAGYTFQVPLVFVVNNTNMLIRTLRENEVG